MNIQKKRVALGLSGGVDSSVAAQLLLADGYEVVGVYMQCWDEKADGCRAEEDRASAVAVASHLGIKFEHINYITQYKDKVIKYFYDEYRLGRTPNPDIMCNKEIKFGLFFDWAMAQGFDYIATGHYARTQTNADGSVNLLKGVDSTKDQSYFLYSLDQAHLSKVVFPIGKYLKSEVRQTAKQAGLPTFNRPDSMGICFIGEVNIADFLKKEISEKTGDVIDTDGSVVGKHRGVWFYTIGQRHGFELTKYYGVPVYVIDKNVDKNELVIGLAPQAYSIGFAVDSTHFINKSVDTPFSCDVRVRHLGELFPCTVTNSGKQFIVNTKTPVFGIASGQSAVFYNGDVVLGGGVISSNIKNC